MAEIPAKASRVDLLARNRIGRWNRSQRVPLVTIPVPLLPLMAAWPRGSVRRQGLTL